MRRRNPELPTGMPRIEHKPGMAAEMLRELAPLLAEDGIDIDGAEVPDMETLQRALDRAVERRNMELFSPIGATREIAVVTLRLIVEAILDSETRLAGSLIDQIQPESSDNSVATVSSCIGIALGLLDDWLSGQADEAPVNLGELVRLPPGHWTGGQAATDILALARKRRSFSSLDKLLIRRGGPQVLAGSVLALAAAVGTWSETCSTPRAELIRTAIR